MQGLLDDEEATALGILAFSPKRCESNGDELKVNNISELIHIGRGSMPDTQHLLRIDEKEVQECEDMIKNKKYATL